MEEACALHAQVAHRELWRTAAMERDTAQQARTWPLQQPGRCMPPQLGPGSSGVRNIAGTSVWPDCAVCEHEEQAEAEAGCACEDHDRHMAGWLWKRFGHGHATKWKRLWVRCGT